MSTDDNENFIKDMVEDDEPKPKRGRPKNSVKKEDQDGNVFVENDEDEALYCSPNDPNWTQYVLSKLRKNEFDAKGNPTTNGIRRVAELLLGPIVRTKVNVVQPPNSQNGSWAVVEYTVVFRSDEDGPNQEREFADASDANPENCDEPFDKHLTATATTKAEGRALRKALKLYGVFVSEEFSEKTPMGADSTTDLDGDISSTQINAFDFLCKSANVDIMKFINADPKQQYESIKQVSKEKAAEMLKVLQAWKRDKSLVKDKYKGYKSDWRSQSY